MYLAARTRTLVPATVPLGVAASVDAGKRVEAITGHKVNAFTTVHSPGLGRVFWSIWIESLKELEELTDVLAADAGWNSWLPTQEHLFTGGVDDLLHAVVHGGPNDERPAYLTVTTSACANGMVAKAMAGGVEAAMLYTRLTGRACLFASCMTGTFGGVMWSAGASDLGAIEATGTTLGESAEWLDLVDRIGPCFQPGGTATMLRRLA